MRTRSLSALALAGTLALTAAACGAAAGPSASPSAGPSTPGSSAGSETPRPSPTDVPGAPRVTLDIAAEWDVVAIVNDRTTKLTEATSGTAGATMSVQWFKSIVKNLDANTIQITWVGLPRDEEIRVDVSRAGTSWAVEFTQASPPLNSDAEGADRIIVLKFSEAVPATDVAVTFGASNPS
jgi:hypothetical protein